jgi:hypothetical protein
VKRAAAIAIVALSACRVDAQKQSADAATSAAIASSASSASEAPDARDEDATVTTAKPTAANAKPLLPRLAEIDLDDVTYPVPSDDEWLHAKSVALEPPSWCDAATTRGWLRVHCSVTTWAGVSVLGGSRDGLYVSASDRDATIVAPLRRGDRRVVQVTDARAREWWDGQKGLYSYYGPPQIVARYIVSIAWLDSRGPIATARAEDESRD